LIYVDDGRICMCHGRDKILSQRVEFHPGPFPLILEEESHAKFGRSIDHSSSLIIYLRSNLYPGPLYIYSISNSSREQVILLVVLYNDLIMTKEESCDVSSSSHCQQE